MKEIGCPVCSNPLSVKTAEGRKSHKPFIMFICEKDPRHFRGFITDQEYIRGVLYKNEDTLSKKEVTKGRGKG
jgi:hypothetical protein